MTNGQVSQVKIAWGRFFAALIFGVKRGADVKLLSLWVLALSLPMLMTVAPAAVALGAKLNHSLESTRIVDSYALATLVETWRAVGRGELFGGGAAGLLLTVLLSPWLTGMVLTARRTSRRLTFGELIYGGLSFYGRLARLFLWALIPLALSVGLGSFVIRKASQYGATAILASDADGRMRWALFVAGALLVVAHATVEAARAELGSEPERRSAVRAWCRGTLGLFRYPSRLVLYLVTTSAGLMVVSGLVMLRIWIPAVGFFGLACSWFVGQAGVVVFAGMRAARLFALIAARSAVEPVSSSEGSV